MNLILGVHVSCTVVYENMAEAAMKLGANAFQFSTYNASGYRIKTRVGEDDMTLFKQVLESGEISHLMALTPSFLNLCSPYPCKKKAFDLIKIDKPLMEMVPGIMYVMPPGNPLGQGKKAGIELITRALNDHLDEGMQSVILLETSSGKKGAIGKTFGEMLSILRRVNYSDKMGICLDISNAYAAGYDLVNNLEGVLEEFERILGLYRLKAIQLADYKGTLGDMQGQHASLGMGKLGYDTIIKIINHPLLKHLPFYLETPYANQNQQSEIARLKENFG